MLSPNNVFLNFTFLTFRGEYNSGSIFPIAKLPPPKMWTCIISLQCSLPNRGILNKGYQHSKPDK